VTVSADRFEEPGRTIKVTQAEVVFVAVDEAGKPKPIFEE
jgi:acyl-CoA hydrolase